MIDFQGTWNNMAAGFPVNAKFSPLAGCSHNKDYTMWDSDISASEGIKLAAEKGKSELLNTFDVLGLKFTNINTPKFLFVFEKFACILSTNSCF